MELIERNHCVVSDRKDLELLYSFKDFPIFMGCVSHPPENDINTDMNWWISKSTGSVQLNPLIPLELLYENSHVSGTTGGLWNLHHKEFAEFIHEFSIVSALEIGACHGELIHNYLNCQPNAKWTIVEPNPNIEPNEQIKVIKGFFDSNFKIDMKIDAVVHSRILEHTYEPYEFMKNISSATSIGTWHFFSIPNFEHTIFITEAFIEYWLGKYGFEIRKKKYFLEDHSIFYATVKVELRHGIEEPEIPDEYDINRKLYMDFIRFHEDIIRFLNNKMDEFSGRVFLFGGHIFAQYLIGFGLNVEKIECIIDNDSNKQGKRLYGTSLMVHLPKILKDMKNAAVILRAGVYNTEIKYDILENINDGVEFWE